MICSRFQIAKWFSLSVFLLTVACKDWWAVLPFDLSMLTEPDSPHYYRICHRSDVGMGCMDLDHWKVTSMTKNNLGETMDASYGARTVMKKLLEHGSGTSVLHEVLTRPSAHVRSDSS